MIGDAVSDVRPTDVEVVSAAELRRLCSGPFDLVKVDVEGAEGVVLPEVAEFDWVHLLVELGGDRHGALSLAEAQELLDARGVRTPVVRDFGAPESTRNVLLRRLSA